MLAMACLNWTNKHQLLRLFQFNVSLLGFLEVALYDYAKKAMHQGPTLLLCSHRGERDRVASSSCVRLSRRWLLWRVSEETASPRRTICRMLPAVDTARVFYVRHRRHIVLA